MEAARLLSDLAEFVLEAIRDAGGCDHSVGICWCETERLAMDGLDEASSLADGEIVFGPLSEAMLRKRAAEIEQDGMLRALENA